ncbi:MAG: hypothetical protein DI539_05980 [Flavobacterium psychrophilum]|nr:MAG: hypothetical protein DI539_05980 [Flavobacterium psychrophilum]
MRKTLKAFLLLFLLNILLTIGCFALDFNDIGIFFILMLSISISLVILIIVFIAERRSIYLSKTAEKKRFARKRTVIIVSCITLFCATGFIAASFANGYKIPSSDRHKEWPHFPESSNPRVVIDSVTEFYVNNITGVKGSEYWLIHFVKNTGSYYDSTNGPVSFGIMDGSCNMKVKYEKDADVYLDGERLIVIERMYDKEADSCDVYDAVTMAKHREKIYPITISKPYEYYPADGKPALSYEQYKKEYGSPFYDGLRGVKGLDEGGYSGSDDRGYILFTDASRKLYKVKNNDDHFSLTLLCKNCEGYKLDKKNENIQTENIKITDESIIWKNHLNSGFSLGFGNPNGNGNDGFYFDYYQTWLIYYTVTIGSVKTSFKTEGGDKDRPYISFRQLNYPKTDTDTLCFTADKRLWKAYVKK